MDLSPLLRSKPDCIQHSCTVLNMILYAAAYVNTLMAFILASVAHAQLVFGASHSKNYCHSLDGVELEIWANCYAPYFIL